MSEPQPRFKRKSFENELAIARTDEDDRALERILAEGSKSFAAAGKLLPRRMRASATAVYAFCRIADDAIDEAEESEAALATLTERLDRIYETDPLDHLVDRAFHKAVTAYAAPGGGGVNAQFWAVLTLGFDPDVQVLVASTNQYPGHSGDWYEGLYYIQGSEIVRVP